MPNNPELVSKLKALRDEAFALGNESATRDVQIEPWLGKCIAVLSEVFGEASPEVEEFRRIPGRLKQLRDFEAFQRNEVRSGVTPDREIRSRNEACRRVFTDAAEILTRAISSR